MLLQACQEVEQAGENPEFDIAVAILAGRIGFVSPSDSMTGSEWHALIDSCRQCIVEPMRLNPEARN
jgi:hypothetical protein